MQQWYARPENRQKVLDRNNKLCKCACGRMVQQCNLARHQQTNRHLRIVAEQDDD
jgi:hypothetical protein